MNPERGKSTYPTRIDTQQKWIACKQCDLLQREVELPSRSDAHCSRCNALLYRSSCVNIDTMIAVTLACLVLFIVSNLFPIAALFVQSIHVSTTLTGAVLALYQQGRPLVAVLVFCTIMLVPALELTILLYLLVLLRLGRLPVGLSPAFRFILTAHPWGMMEVFMLGVLVTLVKLADLATVVPGIALWSFTGVILLFSFLSASFSIRDFWNWVDQAREARQ